MKTFNNATKFILVCFLAILMCQPFLLRTKNNVFANNQSVVISNTQVLQINLASGANRTKNNSLIDKTANDFYESYIYSSINTDWNNSDMIFSFSQIEFDAEQSFFVWIFIPSLIVQDLVIELYDGVNGLSWKLEGIETSENGKYNGSLKNMIVNFGGSLSRGWKLLELSPNDASIVGEKPAKLQSMKVSYGFLSNIESQDDAEFALTYPFIAESQSENSQIVDYQDYVVYSQKESVLTKSSQIYVGDKLKINSEKDFFNYAVIGKQNILDNASGYVWNMILTKPSGSNLMTTLDQTREIDFAEKGYYLLEIMLTTISEDYYAIISETVNLYVEEFAFGYFQKHKYNLSIGTENIIIFSLSKDFEILGGNVSLASSDESIASVSYEIDENKIYLKVVAHSIGETQINISAQGIKNGELEEKLFEASAEINVVQASQNTNNVPIWIIFAILMTGFATYLIILFVKSRKFGVK